jgi:hypothetical protein
MTKPSVADQNSNKRKLPGQMPPKWVTVAGAIFGGVSMIFFMALVIASLANYEVPAASRFLVLIVLSFGAALSVGFLGGSAVAHGKIPFPGALKNTIAISTAGGVAVLLILMLVGYYLYVRPEPLAATQIVIALPSSIPRDFTIDNLSPGRIVDVGEVRTIGNRHFLYVEFLPGKSSGDVRLTYLKETGAGFENVEYQVTLDGGLVKQSLN